MEVKISMADQKYNAARILMVEDDDGVLKLNRAVLERQGYEVFSAQNLKRAKEILDKTSVSLILLDIMLPDGSGLEFIPYIRKVTDAPIILLTSRKESEDIVYGLDHGADDYITKPYKIEELRARVMAILRREKTITLNQADEIITADGFEFNITSQKVYYEKKDLMLTPKEFVLFGLFLKNKGKIISYENISGVMWDKFGAEDPRALRTIISRLRKKLADTPANITMERNKGYTMD